MRCFLVGAFVLISLIVPAHPASTDNRPFIVGAPDAEAIRKQMVLEARQFSKEERELMIQIALDCQLPIRTDIYSQNTLDKIQASCDGDLSRYKMEYLHPSDKAFREFDNQFSNFTHAYYWEVSVPAMALGVQAETIAIKKQTGTVKAKDWTDYNATRHRLATAISNVNEFVQILGAVLAEARQLGPLQ